MLLAVSILDASGRIVKGIIKDARTGEDLVGATIVVKGHPTEAAVSGLDGSFSLSPSQDRPTLVCSYIGYNTVEIEVGQGDETLTINLQSNDVVLSGVEVTATNRGQSDMGARLLERNAVNVMNVMSQKAIELSPDLTVANVIQRMSGVTMERNSSGEGQYAILRGMDKRYNYTLVNGVKIPSPDNKNRFVPLDIFPSELLERLEVAKSLTADMEGDGIGGAVNMVMKDAPSARLFTVNVSTGYSSHFFDNDFQSFRYGDIAKKSPLEKYGNDYPVDIRDFTTKNLRMSEKKPLPDLSAGVTYGDRFFKRHLGLLAAVSFSIRNKGKLSDMYDQTSGSDGSQDITNRFFSEQQTRLGAHLKLDYDINSRHKLTWYNGYMDFRNAQVRDAVARLNEEYRMRWERQYIMNSTLKGDHNFLEDNALNVKWTFNIASAKSETPDNTFIELTNNEGSKTQWVARDLGAYRRWEHNTDDDIAGYLDLDYKLHVGGGQMDIMFGGMYRDKKRKSFYNQFNFQPYDADKGGLAVYDQYRGEDWNNFDEIKFQLTSVDYTNPLNYNATEKIGAGYGQIRYHIGRWQFIAGIRAEHTDQGYTLLHPTADAANEGNQSYIDWLPDAHIKFNVHKNANLRLSYYRAINRPSFFEIVPYHIIEEDYIEAGNPDLKHSTADNFDLRYEFFPRSSEQFMACVFYKRIQDPIEYGMVPSGQVTYYTPGNYGDASNWGIELDITKYFNWFGIKANYTFTHSSITTQKIHEVETADGTITTEYKNQTRPLFGQAAHVFNCSLLFKDAKHGWDGQLAFSYTGKRLAAIERKYENDRWDAGMAQLDFSLEKAFKCGLSLFLKGQNLLNTPMIRYYHANDRNANIKNVRRYDGGIVEREEKTGATLMLGARFKL